MNRILLIARREFAAYAMTVGFWLSLLALPMFALLGVAMPMLMKSSEPVREVVLLEDGPQASGLAAAVREALATDVERQAEIAREAAEKAGEFAGAGMGAEAAAGAASSVARPKLNLVEAPDDLADTVTAEEREARIRYYLGDEVEKAQQLDAVVILTRNEEGRPTARVWSRRATDNTVRNFVRDAMKDANRAEVFGEAGIDPAIVRETGAYDPKVVVLSPSAASGGEVSFRDKLPGIIGFGSAFLLWSLIITGASILLNSVMEEKSNKILEVLMSSASATEILTGKVLGVAMLTATVLLAWGGIGAAGLLNFAPEQAMNVGQILLTDGMLLYFAAYAIGGYLMYAVLFAAIGAFCETPRDAQTLMGPIMMVLVVPIIVVQMALQTPDAPLVKILSWVPFFTPFLMAARAHSDPPMIEIVGTMVGMFAMALFMVWVAGRAFRAGALSDVKLSWKSFLGAVRGGGR
ncbi:ABC transporter permease [Brevundimonas poindexterae]|uniref:ABC transporter permease n=1 Tax=Brevundimonas poindexterae TaxID=74325 RepID=UPI001CFE1C4D|nr:ABC transporter permease [Brevundimonas poindexterae]